MTAAPFALAITAAPADIDELGHVNNAVWVRWVQDAATAHWIALAEPAHVATYLWVVIRHEIDFLRALKVGETVTARTWVDGLPHGAKFDRIVEFAGADGRIHVRARTTWAIVDKASGRALRIPASVAAPFMALAEDAP